MKRILVVQMGFLGDVILSSPLLANLKQLYPEASLYTLTTPQAVKLYRSHPHVTEALAFDKRGAHSGVRGALRIARALRQREFDAVFSLHRSFRTAAVLALAGIPVRYGFSEAAGAFLYTETTPRQPLEHDVLRNLSLLEVVGWSPDELSQELLLEIPSEVRDRADELLYDEERPVVAIAPGSVWATKRWTVEGFAAVARDLTERGFRVLILGGEEDKDTASAIEQQSGFPVINLVGKADLLLSAALIERCEVLITNDSAPLHIGSAVQTPTVAIFCATVPEFGFGPWRVPSEIVEVTGLHCRPCGRHGGQSCPTGTHACQRQIHPTDVLMAVERVLKRTSPVLNCLG